MAENDYDPSLYLMIFVCTFAPSPSSHRIAGSVIVTSNGLSAGPLFAQEDSDILPPLSTALPKQCKHHPVIDNLCCVI